MVSVGVRLVLGVFFFFYCFGRNVGILGFVIERRRRDGSLVILLSLLFRELVIFVYRL